MSGDIFGAITKMLDPLKTKMRLMVSKAVVALIDDGKKIQQMQLLALAGEVLADVERYQQFGFTSVPLPGAEAIVAFIAGDREHGIVLGVEDRRYRPTGLTNGQACFYDILSKIKLTADGKALHDVPVKTEIKSAEVVLGAGVVLEKILNGETFQVTYNSHTHLSFGVPTTSPILASTVADLSQAVKAAKLQA